MTNNKNVRFFKATQDSKEVDVEVRVPSQKLANDAGKVYNGAWTNAVKSGNYILQSRVNDLAKQAGLLTEEVETKVTELAEKLLGGERKLAKGGIPLWGLDKESGQSVAIQMIRDRSERLGYIMVTSDFYERTAEAFAEATRFNYIVPRITFYSEDGVLVFKDENDYLARIDEDIAQKATLEAQILLYGDSSEGVKTRVEYKFLTDHKMVDDKMRLINKEGHLINLIGKRIDEDGYLLNDDGKRVDDKGNLLDEKGDYLVEFVPFTD
jgi:hypothetical protein